MNRFITSTAAFVILLAASFSASAQKFITKDKEIRVFAGVSTKIKSNQEFDGLAHYSSERVTTILTGGRNDEFNVYDTLMNIVESYTTEDAKYGHINDKNLIAMNGKHYILKDSVDEASSTAFVYMAELNLSDGKPGEYTELTKLEGDAYFKYFGGHYISHRIADKGDV